MDVNADLLVRLAISAFFAILFLQSGLDKVFDRSGNLAWMTPHFESSPFRGKVPMMLSLLTVFEIGSGLLCLAALAAILGRFMPQLPLWAMAACTLTLLQLFLGQRLAKDYAGAASLVPYFLVAVYGLASMQPLPMDFAAATSSMR